MNSQGGHTGLRWFYSWLWFINNERIQSQIAKGKGAWGGVQRKSGTSFQESFLSGFTQDVLNSSSLKLWRCMRCLLGSLIRDLVPRAFNWSWSHRPFLSSPYQNSILLEGKQLFIINRIVCTKQIQWATVSS